MMKSTSYHYEEATPLNPPKQSIHFVQDKVWREIGKDIRNPEETTPLSSPHLSSTKWGERMKDSGGEAQSLKYRSAGRAHSIAPLQHARRRSEDTPLCSPQNEDDFGGKWIARTQCGTTARSAKECRAGEDTCRGRRIVLRIVCALFVLLVFISSANAVELRDYYLTCDSSGFAEILANPFEDIYVDCSFEYNGFIWPDARIRLRGEDSRAYPKKSFKINFDADNRFGNRDKINLISCWTDASFIREHLSYDLYRRAGLFASETWYARFFVNGVYMGLYLDVEQVDEHFLGYTDLPDDASIYKADASGSMLSNNENLYAVWKKETNTDTGIDDLIELRTWLDQTPASGFDKLLPRKFDPEILARVIAVNTFIGNQSTYYHNYFLVHDISGSGQWMYLPWDMDLTFYYADNYREPPYYRSSHQSDCRTNPLISKSWCSPGMRHMIFDEMENLSEELLEGNYYANYIAELRTLLHNAVEEDTLKQFTLADFEAELTNLPGAIEERRQVILDQIVNEPAPFLLKRSMLNNQGTLLYWTPAISPNGEPVTYDIQISDNTYFTGELVTIPGIQTTWYLMPDLPETDQFYRVYSRTSGGMVNRSISYYEWVVNELPPVEGRFELEPISGDRVFTEADGPYLLPAGLAVEESGSLTVEPGAVIKLGMEQSLHVRGGLNMIGTASDSILVEPIYEDHPWSSIYISDPSDTIKISFASFRDGGVLLADSLEGSMIYVMRGTASFSHCRFRDAFTASGGIAAWNSVLNLDSLDIDLPLESYNGELNWPDALLTFGGAQTITNCRFVKSEGTILSGDLIDLAGAVNTRIQNCTFANAGDDAIDFDYTYDCIVSGNTITGCDDHAMSLGAALGLQIYNNIIYDCANGILAKVHSEMTLYNNVIAGCGSGIQLDSGDPPASVVLRNCAFQDNVTAIDQIDGFAVDAQYCGFSGDYAYPGEHNLSGDLRFLDVPNRDFRLRSTSPLIDAGWGTGSPERDFRDSMRADIPEVENTGGGEPDYVDIGAFEYLSSDPIDPDPVPDLYLFVDNYPNPFNGYTTLRFNVARSGPVEVVIYDVLGRRVFGNVWYDLAPGTHTAVWDARTNSGNDLASGSYFVRLKQRAGSVTAKLVILR
jgi:parallel beta-helix repeat protein